MSDIAIRRRGLVYNHGILAGTLDERADGSFVFAYHQTYLARPAPSPISLTLPCRSKPYTSDHLFPFFYGLLSEGGTRTLQSRLLRIDEEDHFGLLLATAADTIGSVTITPQEDPS
jgi:HipA-like protein